MITGFTIKEVSYHGTVVEYHDDRGISKSFNLIPPIDKDGNPLIERVIRKEILRCVPNLDKEYNQLKQNIENMNFCLNIDEKYPITQSDIDNWDTI